MKRKNRVFILSICALIMGCSACHNNSTNNNNTTVSKPDTVSETKVTVPAFNADTAYYYTQKQVDFGPRIPGSKAHKECLDFIVAQLEKDSMHPVIQKTKARTFDGKQFEIDNVIASSEPKNNVRIMLCTHWDTRPWADLDSVDDHKSFDGADDGASGVAMLLELANKLKQSKAGTGVDLVFFDLEDYGQQDEIDWETDKYKMQDNTWCLGSQYWASNLPTNYIMPRFGILLDMVGGKNAVFPMEGQSLRFAPQVVDKMWNIAAQLGYGNYFSRDRAPLTIDDHLYVNTLAGIPTIDIVHYDVTKHDYPYFHHKHGDNMSVLDKNTMHAVGTVLLNVIYRENSVSSIP